MLSNQESVAHEKDAYVPYASRAFLVEKKVDLEAELRKPEMMEKLSLYQNDFTKKDRMEMAKKQYEIISFYEQALVFEQHPTYQDLFEKAKKTNEKLGTLGRTLMMIMKPVLFDQNGTPLAEYEQNHKWNLRWLQVGAPTSVLQVTGETLKNRIEDSRSREDTATVRILDQYLEEKKSEKG